jgi:hypothetical protein
MHLRSADSALVFRVIRRPRVGLDNRAHPLRPIVGTEVHAVGEQVPQAIGARDPIQDELAISNLGVSMVVAERCERRLDVEPIRCIIDPYCRSIARPTIGLRLLDDSCPNWIEDNVSKDFGEVRLFLDQKGLEASLEKFPDRLCRLLNHPAYEPLSHCMPRDRFGLGVWITRWK